MTEASTLSCGSSMPRLPQNSRDQAPPASTTVWQAMRPFSVTTADDPSARGLDAAHRALGHDRRAMPPRRLGDRRRRPLRLGLAVARGVERARPVAGQTGHQLGRFGAADDAGVELILAGVLEPGFELARARPGSRRDT